MSDGLVVGRLEFGEKTLSNPMVTMGSACPCNCGGNCPDIKLPPTLYEFAKKHEDLYPDMMWEGHKLVKMEDEDASMG